MIVLRRLRAYVAGALALLLFAPLSAFGASDHVITKGKLSDRDFYRLVACAAPPGGKCQKPLLKWSKAKRGAITIRLTSVGKGFPSKQTKSARAALQNAVSQINSVGSGVRLKLIAEGKPDISVVLTADTIMTRRKPRSIQEVFELGGAGAMAEIYWPRGTTNITRARVTITDVITTRYMTSVMLEEVVQALGLQTDIHNRYYHNRSIFSETGSRIKRLRGQDAKALLMHYPP